MNNVMFALGLSSLMMCIGLCLRAKLGVLQKLLVPVSVLGGVFGFLFMNIPGIPLKQIGVTEGLYSTIVDVLFTLSFISIGLTSSKKKPVNSKEEKKANSSVRGAMGMGLIWCFLFALTAVIGGVLISIIGKPFGMDGVYGTLIPYGFCQGPGQASTFGKLFETTYGYPDAEMVALTFAVVGFLVAFVLGVPLAKKGMQIGLTKNSSKLNPSVEKGIYTVEEQRESLGKVTTHSGNIETLAVHFAVMGVTYLLAIGMSRLIYRIPMFGPTFGAMTFMCGMMAAYLVKWGMNKFHITHLLDRSLLGRITGFTSDYLVVAAFMAIKMDVIGNWLLPIIIECVVIALITFVVCIYFGSRLGSDHDFERILGLYGTCTGTTPSGVALLRMVDPRLVTTTAMELGMMNMVMFLTTPTMIIITLFGTNVITFQILLLAITGTVFLYLALMKLFRTWRKQPSFRLRKGTIQVGAEEDGGEALGLIKGFLREDTRTMVEMVRDI